MQLSRLRPNPSVGEVSAPSGRAQLLASLRVKAAQEAPARAEGRAALLKRLQFAGAAPGVSNTESSGYSAPSSSPPTSAPRSTAGDLQDVAQVGFENSKLFELNR